MPMETVKTTHYSKQFYKLSKEALFTLLKTSAIGLTNEESRLRLQHNGPNTITKKHTVSPISIWLSQFKNTLTLVLIASAVLILFIYFFGERDQSDLFEAGLILAIVMMTTLLGFFQEYKAERSMEKLATLLAYKAKVMRAGQEKEIDVAELVVGDAVILEEGTKVPADIRLFEIASLQINEAALTGESAPVSKNILEINEDKELAGQRNMAFSGTAVISGRGLGIVCEIGNDTEIGQIAQMVAHTEEELTPIQVKLNNIGKLLGMLVIGVCLVVFVFIMFFAQEFQQYPFINRLLHSFVAAVALAVAAIPEGLPAVVTIALAFGTQRMLKRNALIRKLSSVETLGSTDIICSDKTGTLTKGEMTVTQIFTNSLVYDVTGSGYEVTGEILRNGAKADVSDIAELIACGAACNNSALSENKIIGDPTEASLLVLAAKAALNEGYDRVLEVPFSSDRKMMTVVVKVGNDFVAYSKGAPEVILSHCSRMIRQKKDSPMSIADKEAIGKQVHAMSSQALRTLAFAYKRLSAQEFDQLQSTPERIEDQLTFIGLAGMIDPPRSEVRPLIEACKTSGIRVMMITGDHADTAQSVAHQIGIMGEVVSGTTLDIMSDSELAEVVKTINIYARVSPAFKMRVVGILKQQGHVVAMTGDGVNDAPALKKADIGIAMGITGTDVSKEASDMVLMDDKFGTIVAAVEEGRGIYQNIKKFVNYLLSCNIGEVMVVFCAVIIFQHVPLSATLLLWINIVTDGLPAIALGLDPPRKGVLQLSPRAFQTGIITKKNWMEMVLFGALLTIGVLAIYAYNLPEGITEAKGAAFTAMVVFELVRLVCVRNDYKIPFFTNLWVLAAMTLTFVLQLLIIYTPALASIFEVGPIDWYDWLFIAIGSVILYSIAEALEHFFDLDEIKIDDKTQINRLL